MEIAQLILNFIWKHKGLRGTKIKANAIKAKGKNFTADKVVRLILSDVKMYKATLSKTVV